MASKIPVEDERPAAIDQVADLNLAELRLEWARHFGKPPALRSVELMRLMLAWRLQARRHGGFDKATRLRLKRKLSAEAVTADLSVGTVLSRDWQGQRLEVTVEESGYRWLGQSYPSLSAVASAVTGTRWNGPRFFGLRRSRP